MAVVTDTAVADVLEDSAALILEHGWCQGASQDLYGRFCAMGAIRHVATRDHHPDRIMLDNVVNATRSKLVNHVAGRDVEPWWGVLELTMWNDRPLRTRWEVIKAMLGLSARLRT